MFTDFILHDAAWSGLLFAEWTWTSSKQGPGNFFTGGADKQQQQKRSSHLQAGVLQA